MKDPLVSRRFLSARNNLSKLRINDRKWGFVFPNAELVALAVALSFTRELSFFEVSRFFSTFSSAMGVGSLSSLLMAHTLSAGSLFGGQQISANTCKFKINTSSEVSDRVFNKTGNI